MTFLPVVNEIYRGPSGQHWIVVYVGERYFKMFELEYPPRPGPEMSTRFQFKEFERWLASGNWQKIEEPSPKLREAGRDLPWSRFQSGKFYKRRNILTEYKDLSAQDEDTRIDTMGRMAKELPIGKKMAFIVDKEPEDAKAKRYIQKMEERFPGLGEYKIVEGIVPWTSSVILTRR